MTFGGQRVRVRLEFSESKSKSFPWVLRLCKAFPSFRKVESRGLIVYSMVFGPSDLKSFEAIWCKVGAWKNTALYLNGKLISAGDLFDELRDQGQEVAYRPTKPEDQNLLKSRIMDYVVRNGILSNPN